MAIHLKSRTCWLIIYKVTVLPNIGLHFFRVQRSAWPRKFQPVWGLLYTYVPYEIGARKTEGFQSLMNMHKKEVKEGKKLWILGPSWSSTLQHHIVIPSCLLRQPHWQHDCQRSMQSSRFVWSTEHIYINRYRAGTRPLVLQEGREAACTAPEGHGSRGWGS